MNEGSLGDVGAAALLTHCLLRHGRSKANAGLIPRPVYVVGYLVRFQLRIGIPAIGMIDWIEAGCPSCRPSTKARAR